MTTAPTQPGNRLDRRKARTRAALIRAAQTLIAEGRTNVPILEITQAADVGMGSFYNHFETKEQLFEAAVEDVMDGYGQLLDDLTGDIEDPAEVFACSFRLTGRLQRREPELSRVFLNNVLRLLSSDSGLAPRARRDIKAAVDAGRFDVEDLDVAVTMAAGALLALGQLLHDQPERDVEETTDRVTEELSAHVRRDGCGGSSPLQDSATRGDGPPSFVTPGTRAEGGQTTCPLASHSRLPLPRPRRRHAGVSDFAACMPTIRRRPPLASPVSRAHSDPGRTMRGPQGSARNACEGLSVVIAARRRTIACIAGVTDVTS